MLAAPSKNMLPEWHVTLVTRRTSDVVQRYDWLLLVREITVSPVGVASRSSSSNYRRAARPMRGRIWRLEDPPRTTDLEPCSTAS
jgi:hypothetical protein